MHTRILILGGSGFVGQTLYKELQSYYDVMATYCSQHQRFTHNQAYYHFDATTDRLLPLLKALQPTHVISCLKLPDEVVNQTYSDLVTYATQSDTRVMLLSSVAVFDGKRTYPAVETTRPYAVSQEGQLLCQAEKLLGQLPSEQCTVVRLPLVLGTQAPELNYLKDAAYFKSRYEIFPNLVVNVTSDWRMSRQIHYLINRDISGMVHLGSTNLMHHSELIALLIRKLGIESPVLTRVYNSSTDVFAALLSKRTLFPKEYHATIEQLVDEVTLYELSNPLKLSL